MNLFESLIKFVPSSAKQSLIDRIREAAIPGANQILATLYSSPIEQRPESVKVKWSRNNTSTRLPGVSLPLPPMNLVMGYGADPEAFLASGKKTADFVRNILARENLSIGVGDSVME